LRVAPNVRGRAEIRRRAAALQLEIRPLSRDAAGSWWPTCIAPATDPVVRRCGDRSHAERRQFQPEEATDQIIASLRPVLKRAPISLSVDVPEGLIIDGYPGSYGQILTNLFLNAANHAFADGRSGAISISARPRGSDDVEIIFADNGAGMTPDVQRQAFDPFFTTRRNEGGTGLGLHIVYNLVTQQLGGRMMLDSRLGQGTTFRIIMPLTARGGSDTAEQASDGIPQWPNRTMSST
jgi:signal transduction histidine kinase